MMSLCASDCLKCGKRRRYCSCDRCNGCNKLNENCNCAKSHQLRRTTSFAEWREEPAMLPMLPLAPAPAAKPVHATPEARVEMGESEHALMVAAYTELRAAFQVHLIYTSQLQQQNIEMKRQLAMVNSLANATLQFLRNNTAMEQGRDPLHIAAAEELASLSAGK